MDIGIIEKAKRVEYLENEVKELSVKAEELVVVSNELAEIKGTYDMVLHPLLFKFI